MSNDSRDTRRAPQIAWKFVRLRDGALTSEHGKTRWQIGVWQKIAGKPEACARGFHASRKRGQKTSRSPRVECAWLKPNTASRQLTLGMEAM